MIQKSAAEGHSLLGQQPLLMYDKGAKIRVALSDFSDDWKIINKSTQVHKIRVTRRWFKLLPKNRITDLKTNLKVYEDCRNRLN